MTRKLISALALAGILALSAVSNLVYAQTPAKTGNGYLIGPYPTPAEIDGIKANFWTWLQFNPIVEGRQNPTYKLVLSILVQVDNLPSLVREYASKKLSTNNCERYNIDNWVYNVVPSPLEIRDQGHTLRISGSGDVSTWTCIAGLDETVCDSYRDDLGLTWPYNCRLRRGNPILHRNLQQGFQFTKDFYLNSAQDGTIKFSDYKATVWFTGDSPGTQFLNAIALITNNLGAALSNAFLSPQTIELHVPPEYRLFSPRYERGGFERLDGKETTVVSASVSISANQINQFMRRYFGDLWTDIGGSAIAPSTRMTKSVLRTECSKYAPKDSINDCAAKMGWNYDSLPD